MNKSEEIFIKNTLYLETLKYREYPLLWVELKIKLGNCNYEDSLAIRENRLKSFLRWCENISKSYCATCEIIVNHGLEKHTYKPE